MQLRDATTDRTLSVSTATMVRANMSAECIAAEVIADCLNRPVAAGATAGFGLTMRTYLTRLLHAQSGRDGFIVVAVLWILTALATLATHLLGLCDQHRDRLHGA